VNADLRARDPAYEELRFEPVHRAAGDVRARALTRADDAWQSILLLSRAVRRLAEPDAPDDALAAGVEGPRGPVAADRVAPQVTGELAAGDEWGAAPRSDRLARPVAVESRVVSVTPRSASRSAQMLKR
jgi:hypothetical protein